MHTGTRRAAGLLAALAYAVATPGAAAQDDVAAPDFTGETAVAQWTHATEETCADPHVAPLLAPFGDDNLYFLAPGGDFEDGGQGWTLEGGAEVAFGSGAFAPLGGGQRSLRLPDGAAATSPAFCVDERFPKFRLTVGQLGTEKAKVRVSVVYPGLEKNVRREKDLDAPADERWKLSKALDVKPLHGRKRGGWRLVALRVEIRKSADGADTRIDDILVDPKMRF